MLSPTTKKQSSKIAKYFVWNVRFCTTKNQYWAVSTFIGIHINSKPIGRCFDGLIIFLKYFIHKQFIPNLHWPAFFPFNLSLPDALKIAPRENEHSFRSWTFFHGIKWPRMSLKSQLRFSIFIVLVKIYLFMHSFRFLITQIDHWCLFLVKNIFRLTNEMSDSVWVYLLYKSNAIRTNPNQNSMHWIEFSLIYCQFFVKFSFIMPKRD